MREHHLKTDTPVFEAVMDGSKTFELRKDDRGYGVGDQLRLRETKHSGVAMAAGAPLEYTGREVVRTVSHVLSGYGLQPGWVCLSFAQPEPEFMRICNEELARRRLVSHPLKFEFARQRGMSGLDEVHAWMVSTAQAFEHAVRALGGGAARHERGEG